jgi:hypothetical protein
MIHHLRLMRIYTVIILLISLSGCSYPTYIRLVCKSIKNHNILFKLKKSNSELFIVEFHKKKIIRKSVSYYGDSLRIVLEDNVIYEIDRASSPNLFCIESLIYNSKSYNISNISEFPNMSKYYKIGYGRIVDLPIN